MKKRVVHWASRAYPAAWRRRYGAEFAALVEESGGGWAAMADVLIEGLAMRLKSVGIWKLVVACGVAGVAIAGVVSWAMPRSYISTAVLRIPTVPDRPFEQVISFNKTEQAVLSQSELQPLIEKYNLYESERGKRSMEDLVSVMRNHDVRIRPVGPNAQGFVALAISFTAGSPSQSEQVTAELVTKFIEQSRALGDSPVELLDPPSSPQRAVSLLVPNVIAIGLLLGLFAGLLTAGVRRWPLVAVLGLAGALIAVGGAHLLPRQYVSTAVLQGDAVKNAQALVSESELLRAIENPAFNLYPDERAKLQPGQVADRMRRDVRISPLHPPAGARETPYPIVQVSFTYSDARTAQAVTQQLVTQLTGAGAELLDPPTFPEQPLKPRPAQLGAIGLLLGMLGGAVWTWRRMRAPVTLLAA